MPIPKANQEIQVTVIICHHTGDLIFRCLKSVQESFLGACTFKVVVVTSTDRVFDDVITHREPGGPAHKRNLAVNLYGKDSKYLIFLDDDTEVSSYTFWTMVAEMEERPKVGMGFIKILKMDRRDVFDDCGSWITPTGFLWARAGNDQQDRGQFDTAEPCLASKSAACIARRSSFIQAGGFDSDYFILGEETLLAYTIWLMGEEVWYFPGAKAWHAFDTKLKLPAEYYTLFRIHFLGARNYVWLLTTCLGGWRLMWILPVHLMVWHFAVVGFLVKGEYQRAWLVFRGMWTALLDTKKLLKKRRFVQKLRKVSDRELFKTVYRNPGFRYFFGRLNRYLIRGVHG